MERVSTLQSNQPDGIRLRVFGIGLILALANAYWISVNDLQKAVTHTYMSLFSNAVFTLFVLILLNLLFRRYVPKFALRNPDILVIYIMVVTASTVAGHRMNRVLSMLVQPFWFATPENDWRNLFWRYIPEWFTVKDETALSGFFLGETSFFTRVNLMAWLGPVLYWSAFLIVLFFVLICINAIIRKQLTEHERLTYPITWMPLELGRDPVGFLRNRLMWIGFGIAAAINLLNGLSFQFPFFPNIPVGWTRFTFDEKPWSYMVYTRISFQPFVIGLAYFMPLDLAFSAWFFYFLKKLTQLSLGVTMGWRNLYFDEQAQGAWIALGALALWVGRRHFKRVFVQAFKGRGSIDESKEPMSYRTAILGIAAGVLFLLWFAYKAGFSAWVLLIFLGLFCCSAIGVTKMRSGLGLPVHELLWVDPARTMVTSVGSRAYGPRNLTILSFLYFLNRDQAAHPMPNQFEVFRIGEQSNINTRKLVWAMLITLILAIPATFLIFLTILYKHGADNMAPWLVYIGSESFSRRLQQWLTFPTGPDYATTGFMGIGVAITGFLLAMKMRFLWWPFHPVGYVLGVSPAEMVYIWVPVLISWCLKFAILRYGGLRAYRRALPFFAGLMLGDYSLGCIWSIINAVFKITVYNMGWHPVLS
ncbi:MAG: hypothetical protein OXP71_15155 [Candidatus Poribacteria bacterium]|nr:hypothetical protein [Candidatus Poribacteria bacterium]